MIEIPLGQRESHRLEFKSRDALARPQTIAREVVGMLNAAGGDIWIGIEDRDGAAVATEPIERAEPARDRLLDHLIDTIEPTPSQEEIRLVVVGEASEGPVLRCTVSPTEHRGPYAHISGTGRHYLRRIGARLRMMSRDEILDRGPRDGAGQGTAALLSDLDKARESGDFFLWIAIQPLPELQIDVQSQDVRRLLQEPEASGNRPHGRVFALRRYEPRLGPRDITQGSGPIQQTRIREDGGIRFRCDIGKGLAYGEAADEIHPLGLVELTVSILRLASALYRDLHPREVLAHLVLLGVKGLALRPYSPGTYGHLFEPPGTCQDPDYDPATPLRFRGDEVVERPDRCALRLLRGVYQAFGLSEDKMPREIDRESGRLVLS